MSYIIEKRYEFWGREGKEFSRWFQIGWKYDNEQEAIDHMKACRDTCLAKLTKMREEFRVTPIEQ